MLFNVYFQNSNGEMKLLDTVEEQVEGLDPKNTYENCAKVIQCFLNEAGYKSYYQRYNFFPKEIIVDVGSYTEFFYIKEKED